MLHHSLSVTRVVLLINVSVFSADINRDPNARDGFSADGNTQPFYHVLADSRDRPGNQSTYVAQARVPSCMILSAGTGILQLTTNKPHTPCCRHPDEEFECDM
jgi:hypothetical protein